ncbi:MAG: FGGY family carbohydrate kinase [Verrucomicrobiae bacterium]|nr:FGGY family carbohydrate kinase [Verrucomicrobiae bacterium]
MEKLYIACELGARTSRVMLGSLEHNTLKLGELARFDSPILEDKKALQWNIPEFFNYILRSLLEVGAQDTDIHSISCHSWGADYLLFDRRETLLSPVYHHLDSRTEKNRAAALRQITPETIYTETNSPLDPRATLFQLQTEPPKRLKQSEVLLLVADAFNHLLGGIACAEMSLASTTQLYTPVSKTWSRRLINDLHLPAQLFPAIVPAGTRLGELKPEIARQTRLEGTQIVATNSHELAASLSSLPLNHGNDWAYVKIGSETLIGTQINDPITTPGDQARLYSHATCLGGTTNLYRQLIGLSIFDACRKFWLERDRELCDDVLMHLATTSPAFEVLIDPADPRFATPEDMPLKIQAYCRETGQEIPRKPGQIIRCVLESLALAYRKAFHELEVLTGRKFARIYLFGAGENTLLNHFIVNAFQVPAIIASPDAAAIGNVIVQALTLRHIPSLEAAHEILRSSYKIQAIIPHEVDWDTPALRQSELAAATVLANA